MTVEETRVKAQEIWTTMDSNQQTGIRFGMFPAKLMREAEAEGYDQKTLTLALMDCASKNGGMRG